MWSKLLMSLSLALGLVVYPQFIGLEFDGALNLNYKTGDYRPVVYYLSVRNTGTQQANFYIKTDVDWVFVYREGYNNSTSVHIYEGGAVNFVLEIHPELVADGPHEAKITITADHLTEQLTFGTKEVKLTFNKNVESIIPTASIEPNITPTPTPTLTSMSKPISTATPTLIKPILTATPKSTISSPAPTVLSPSPSATRTPSKSIEIKTGENKETATSDSKSFWQILKNIFGWFY